MKGLRECVWSPRVHCVNYCIVASQKVRVKKGRIEAELGNEGRHSTNKSALPDNKHALYLSIRLGAAAPFQKTTISSIIK